MVKNWALVIGINHYEHLPQKDHLKYAVRDAEHIKDFLCNQADFHPDNVLLCSDNSEPIKEPGQTPTRPTRSNLRRILRDKIRLAHEAHNLWFFFSGHGMIGQDNRDYLLPRDAYPRDLEETAVPIHFVIECLRGCQAKNIVMALDMCRRSDGSKGLDDIGAYTAKLAKQNGIITIFSCQHGEKSYEISELEHGAFTYALLEGLALYQTARELEQYLQRRVLDLSSNYGKGQQLPLVCLEPASNYNLPLLPKRSEQAYLTELRLFSQNIFSELDINLSSKKEDKPLHEKSVKPSVNKPSIFTFEVVIVDINGQEITRSQKQAQYIIEDLGNGINLEMVIIPGGTFLMGSPKSECKQFQYDEPQHSVTVNSFLMSKYPITQEQWKAVASFLPKSKHDLKLRPSRCGGKIYPVTKVSWYDAVEFCERLSHKTGFEYRLPTEAEWEYACRAGTTTPFHFGDGITSNLASYDASIRYRSSPLGNSYQKTTPVGSFQVANAFGLFDMHGNAWEWCLDHWHDSYLNAPNTGSAWLDENENHLRVCRGGSWKNEPLLCRSAHRLPKMANDRCDNLGFRIIRTL